MGPSVSPPDSRVRLLPRFYLVLALALITVFTAASTGFGLFSRLLNILVVTMALSYGWNWLALRSLVVNVDRRTRQARVGDPIQEEVTVLNQGWLPKHDLEVEDTTDLPGYTGGMAVSLGGSGSSAGASSTWTTSTPARKRGVYTLGPMRVANTDPFGLFRREGHFGGTNSLTVYPRTLNLPGFDLPTADLAGDSVARKRTQNVTPYASSVREYAPGDSLSRVHWNSTARLGRLMSKDFDLGRAGEVWVLVDLHLYVQSGELEESTDEYAVTIGASIAKKYLQTDLPVGLIAYGDERYFLPAETGSGQLHRMMQSLAMSKAEGTTPLEVVLPKEEQLWSHHSSLVVITSSPRSEWATALRQLVKRGVKVAVVLLDANSFGGFRNTLDVMDQLAIEGLPTYVVRQGDDISTALSNKKTVPLAPDQPEAVEATA